METYVLDRTFGHCIKQILTVWRLR